MQINNAKCKMTQFRLHRNSNEESFTMESCNLAQVTNLATQILRLILYSSNVLEFIRRQTYS